MKRDRPRLWCISELYYPEQGTAAHLLTQIAEGLVADYDVHVLCGQPDYFEGGAKAAAREERNGTTICRVRGLRLGRASTLSRLVNALSFMLAVLFFALWHFRRGDRLLAATNPPPLPIMVGLVSKLRGCRATLLVHDVYPEVLAAAGTLRDDALTYKMLTALFQLSYRMFNSFVVLGEDMKRVVQEKLSGSARPCFVIPNWADSDIGPIDRVSNPFRHDHNLTGKFVVQFSGNFGRTHDIELLLDAARLLEDRPDIVFLFVGAGSKASLVAQNSDAPKNTIFLPRQPRALLSKMLAASDATVISFIDGMLGLSVPSRMYNIMAAGVPIIASAHRDSELAREVTASNSGWVLEKSDASELADLVCSLAEPHGLADAQLRGRNGRQAVLDRYLVGRAIELYRTALSGPGPGAPRDHHRYVNALGDGPLTP